MSGNFGGNRNTMQMFTNPGVQMPPSLSYIPPRTAVTFEFINNFGGETRRNRVLVRKNIARFVSLINGLDFNGSEIFIQISDFTRFLL